jgi:hypothetical protein
MEFEDEFEYLRPMMISGRRDPATTTHDGTALEPSKVVVLCDASTPLTKPLILLAAA